MRGNDKRWWADKQIMVRGELWRTNDEPLVLARSDSALHTTNVARLACRCDNDFWLS